MPDRFEQEFYGSKWRRVLPLGPDGIQPYIRASGISRRPGLQAALGRLIATLGAIARSVNQGRSLCGDRHGQPMPEATGARAERQRASLRLVQEAARPVARRASAMRRRSRAA